MFVVVLFEFVAIVSEGMLALYWFFCNMDSFLGEPSALRINTDGPSATGGAYCWLVLKARGLIDRKPVKLLTHNLNKSAFY